MQWACQLGAKTQDHRLDLSGCIKYLANIWIDKIRQETE
jgi:hypothetical protein